MEISPSLFSAFDHVVSAQITPAGPAGVIFNDLTLFLRQAAGREVTVK